MTVVDVGESDGVGWVATEHVLGESVHEILRQAERGVVPVPWAIATRIVADAADALAAMHARRGARGEAIGVHGSLSPRSLLVTYTGTTKLKPAFALDRDCGIDPRDLAYVRPRASGASAVDAAGDVYALAAILWELCAGRRLEVWDARARRDLPSLTRVAGVPEFIDTIVRRALGNFDGAPRGTARELARALRGALVVEGVVVEEDDVGRYLESRFAERHAQREAELHDADGELSEVFRFAAMDAPDTVRDVASVADDGDDGAGPNAGHAEARRVGAGSVVREGAARNRDRRGAGVARRGGRACVRAATSGACGGRSGRSRDRGLPRSPGPLRGDARARVRARPCAFARAAREEAIALARRRGGCALHRGGGERRASPRA